ncbi:MAG: tetratricopeptide repeat protein, partial [Firmicutes bacterium]|nr:tetratricopeptide repeat protein [Bacillota bacterium]
SAEVWKRIEEDYRDKNYQSTLKSLAVLLAQDPTNARIYLYLARCHEALGNTEEAEKFRKAYEVFQ